MKKAFARTLILVGGLLVLGAVNYSIYAKERIKSSGDVIYLQLAPVDPRSLIQGDYMALRFNIAREAEEHPAADHRIPLQLDERRIATVASRASTLHLRYRMRNGQVWIGTNGYFFEEGTADRFSRARYGKFRVDPESGEAVLVGLCDDQLRELGDSGTAPPR
jgi:uncharacterized membrane-anchored protein